MLRPKCEICGEPAVIHKTAVADEGAVTWHFCQDHGQATMPAVILRPQGNQAAGSISASSPSGRNSTSCPCEWKMRPLIKYRLATVATGMDN
jgi:hypothetical protein